MIFCDVATKILFFSLEAPMKHSKLLLSILFFLIFGSCVFADANEPEKTVVDRDAYQIQIKQYQKDYPVVLYVVFKEPVLPPLENVKKILKTELLLLSKKEGLKNNIIASAWFNNPASGNQEKIELSKKYSSLVWVSGKQKTIMTFSDYINFLKKKKEEERKKEK